MTDAELLVSIRAGDAAAFTELFERDDFHSYAAGEAGDTVAIVAAGLPDGAAAVELARSLCKR